MKMMISFLAVMLTLAEMVMVIRAFSADPGTTPLKMTTTTRTTRIASASSCSSSFGQSPLVLQLSSSSSAEEVRAQALTQYLVKAHDEKLRAVQEVERRKNAEIEALQTELAHYKSLSSSSSSSRPAETTPTPAPQPETSAAHPATGLWALTKEFLIHKIEQYQQFMAQYIVNAQEQKRLAVLAAQEATEKKWQERLQQQQQALGGAAASPSSNNPIGRPLLETPGPRALAWFRQRNVAVAKSGRAGRSRWGDSEIQRALAAVQADAAPTDLDAASSARAIEQADHGLRADGGVSGPTLAQRIQSASGSLVVTSTPVAAPVVESVINGGSGLLHAHVASSNAPPPPFFTTIVPPPEVVAADHGLRADGSVGGPSLAERVARGAAAVTTSSTVVVTRTNLSPVQRLVQQRNARVLASAAAGSTRWGKPEIERVQTLPVVTETAPKAAASAGLDVPHVNGAVLHRPSARINLGAAIVAQAAPSVATPTLAQRGAHGVNVGAALVAAAAHAVNGATGPGPLYQQRNAQVLAAAQAGKSRWGSLEVARIQSAGPAALVAAPGTAQAAPVVVPEEVLAADHGLRSNGDVGGPSLAERVAWGSTWHHANGWSANTNGVQSPPAVSVLKTRNQELYQQRNHQVLASAQAGHSRWGPQEVDRVRSWPAWRA